MKKQHFIAGLLFSVIIIIGLIIKTQYNHPTYELRCKNEMFQRKTISNGETLVLHTNFFVFLYKDGRGSITQRGELVKDGTKFLVHRELPFSYIDSDNDGMYTFTRLKGVKYPDDNVPDALAKYFPYLLEDATVPPLPRHIQLTQLNNDLFLINELTAPYLLCQRF
ncbi:MULTISPECIES: hypothetical protein [unclassified Serratia (in: enterobacteria)]|uniref:hypothetical protein n=1 Tax=unclassified Serratia (in: enterobacteria) TaxID=2647522 RepID=UPI002ED14D00|nr:hypothetical protein [Serratia sp. C2(2)]MEE4449675.1 hypothetical protein [Serratia sp. C2(1)]